MLKFNQNFHMQHRSPELKDFIRRNAHLFWYTPDSKKTEVSDELILEQLLNYAELPVIKEYFQIIGLKKAKEIFDNLKGRKKLNIYPEIYKLFSEYFKTHVQEHPE